MRTLPARWVAICALVLPVVSGAACGGAGAAASQTAAASVTAPVTQAQPADVATGRVGERPLVSRDGRLEVRATGPTALEVTIRLMKDPPAMPAGWLPVAPVYEVTARENGTAVTELDQPLILRFQAEGSATVMVYSGRDWLVSESDVSEGSVTATISHLTPYTVGRPSPVLVQAPATATPSGKNVTVPRSTPTMPAVTVAAAATVPADAARPELEAAAERLKGKQVSVSGAGGYYQVELLPPLLQQAMERVAALEGRLTYGQYGGVNDVFTTTVGGPSVNGSLGFVIEQRTVYPATAKEAQALLVDLFPAARGPVYSLQKSASGNFAFFALDGGTGYILGFTRYQGITFAYAAAGSGNYAGIVGYVASNQ